jgi:hypothetical protein
VKHPAWLIDIQDEVRNVFKRRGTASSLSATRPDEQSMIGAVEHAVDSDPSCAGLIAELVAECRSRSVARPNEPSWHFLHGRFLMAAGDPFEARDELEQAALLDPHDPRVTAHLALWYEAALLAATGATTNVGLPPLLGPEVSASAARFAATPEALGIDELARRALQLFEQAEKFRLPRQDLRFLRRHAAAVRDGASNTDVRIKHRALLRAV